MNFAKISISVGLLLLAGGTVHSQVGTPFRKLELGYSKFGQQFEKGVKREAKNPLPQATFQRSGQGDFWQRTNGPEGGRVWTIACDSSGGVFAGLWSGSVYRSTDDGSTWTEIISAQASFIVLSFAINSSGTIFAGTNNSGVLRSTDGGNSWTQLSLEGYINTLSINSSGHIFASSPTVIYRSTDNGGTWAGIPLFSIYSFAFNDSGHVFAGSSSGIYRSTSNGDNWTWLMPSPYASLAINSSGDVFAGTLGDGVYRSTDNGETWIQINVGLSPDTTGIFIAINPSGYILAATLSGRLFRSTNNGDSWTEITTGLASTLFVYLSTNSSGDFLTGTTNGIFRSTDNGAAWHKANTGMSGVYVQSFAANSDYIYAGSIGGGVFRSRNNGHTWTEVNSGLSSFNITELVLNSDRHLFAAASWQISFGTAREFLTLAPRGFFRSTNNGDTWVQINNGLPDSIAGGAGLFINLLDHLFAFTIDGLYRSTNNGDSWARTNSPVRFLLAMNLSGHIFGMGSGERVYRSTDHGETWEERGVLVAGAIAFAINSAGHIFAQSPYGGVFRSTDDGDTWVQVNSGLSNTWFYTLTINSIGHIFVAGQDSVGVFLSTDNGDSWATVNTGLTDPDVTALAVNPSGYVFAGTYASSVFRSVEPTVGVKDRGNDMPLTFALGQNFPNPFNPSTVIRYQLPVNSHVTLKVYDVLGKEVVTLVDEIKVAGYHDAAFDATRLSSGVYFYRIAAGSYMSVKKMLVVK